MTSIADTRYRECIVTFLDVVAFTPLVMQESPSRAHRVLEAVREMMVQIGQSVRYEARYLQFSDSVVKWTPLDSPANRAAPCGLVFDELLGLGHAQGELANAGIWVRGGVALGGMAYETEHVFGPGLVRAHILESQVAVYPRIVIDPELLAQVRSRAEFRKDTHDAAKELGTLRAMLRRDTDGLWWVDYLRVLSEDANSGAHAAAFAVNHRDQIQRDLSALGSIRIDTSRPAAKLVWLAQYHNDFVRQWSEEHLEEHHLDRKSLAVTVDERLLFSFP